MTMATESAVELSPFLGEFQPKHREKLMSLGTEVRFHQDELIFKEDDDPGLFYMILSGRVALEAVRAGEAIRLETLYANDQFGWTSMLNKKRQLQARALEPVRALAFEVEDLRVACRNNPYFGAAFLEKLFSIAVAQLQSTRVKLVQSIVEKN